MKHYIPCFILFTCFIFSTSCGTKEKTETGVLSHSEMVKTIIDVYVAEQKVTALNLKRDSAEFIFMKLNAKVLEANHIQDSVLKKSFDYYLGHPKEMEEIYSAVVDSLNLREQRIISKPTPEL